MSITYERLLEVNKELEAVPIKNKDYVQVNERVKAFRKLCPNGSITTAILNNENGIVTMKAIVADEEGNILATGWAQEEQSSSFINKTSYIENCETSAVGRALGFAGIGIDASMCSAEELVNAINNQNKSYPSKAEMLKEVKVKYPEGSDNLKNLLACFGVEKLEDASDVQIKSAYNKVHK